MTPAEVVRTWVAAFNRADVDALAALYSEEAINHQVAEAPVAGRQAIREMFAREFAQANMVCIVEQILEDGEWAMLEWRDPLGLRGCGFFHVVDGRIRFQRGYWDKLSFQRMHGMLKALLESTAERFAKLPLEAEPSAFIAEQKRTVP